MLCHYRAEVIEGKWGNGKAAGQQAGRLGKELNRFVLAGSYYPAHG
jgi:hypothetical protein